MEVVRMKLEIPQYAGARVRWVEASNTFEIQRPDGSWVTDVTGDYRHAESGRRAARTDIDRRCLAAANATNAFRSTIDTALATFNEIGIASAALSVGLAFIPELVSKGFAIGFAFASLALSIGSEILIEDFDSDCYDAIQCALYCTSDSNAQWSAQRLDTSLLLMGDDARISANALLVCQFILGVLWGEVGLSNAGTMTAVATATCSCDCEWCYQWDFTAVNGSFTAGGAYTTWLSGTGWQGGFINAQSQEALFMYRDFTPSVVTFLSMGYTKTAGSGANNVSRMQMRLGSTIVFGNDSITTGTGLTKTAEGYGTCSRIYIDINTGVSPGTIVVGHILIRGIGTNPFGTDNC